VNCSNKIIELEKVADWRARLRSQGQRLVVTNGCFDLLHAGHVNYLETARSFGDVLLIGLNGDNSVRELKGPQRPINAEADRAAVLSALQMVDAVTIFPEKTATRFLSLVQPDVYVKGGDYTVETLNQEERRGVEAGGGRIVIVPFVPGKSTSALIEKIARL
jgi:D-glycero-beta-D-manno-heptose 1-phosphate adenylyltransferase